MRATDRGMCTAQRHDGSFCEGKSIPGAPFPICVKHAAEIYRHVHDTIEAHDGPHAMFVLLAMEEQRAVPPARGGEPVVYYARVGSLIKIGYTTNLSRRMKELPANRHVLVTEPGGRELERRRHAEFNHWLSAGREWFEQGADLLDHVNRLRIGQGLPVISKNVA